MKQSPASAHELSELLRAGKRQPVDVSAMTQVLHLDETSLLVHAQSGLTLGALEARLAEFHMSLGPLRPWSRDRAIADALAHPLPSEGGPRGRLVDACAALSAVLADGTIIHTRLAPRRASGPDLSHLLLGAGHATGIITAAWLRCRRKPAAVRKLGFTFSDGAAALRAATQLLDRGARPAEMALLGTTLALHLDGAPEMVDAEAALAAQLAAGAREEQEGAWFERGAPRRERFVPTRDLAASWSPKCELVAFSPAGAALISDGKRTTIPTDPLRDALARHLDPDGILRP